METKMERHQQLGILRLKGVPLLRRRRTLALPNNRKTSVAVRWIRSGGAFLNLVLVAMILAPGRPVAAQVNGATNPSGQTQHTRQRSGIDARVKVLAKNLDLNEAQQSAVKNILEQRRQETLRLRLDSSVTPSSRIARFRVLQDKTVERIRAVLNEEQRKKYDPLLVRGIPPAQDQRSVEDWLRLSGDRTTGAAAREDQKP